MSEGVRDGASNAILAQRLMQRWVGVAGDQVHDLSWFEFAFVNDLGAQARRPKQTAFCWVTVDGVDGAVDASTGSAEIGR